MARSQNGWAVVGRNLMDEAPIFGSVRVPNGVLAGDVAVVLRWVARRYHETVEPLVAGHCWGYLVKPIEGSATISNHASGTAIDLNAPAHPMGRPVRENMTQRQIDACHAIERDSGGVVRWGGDFSRPDPMHWEIVGGPAAVAELARRIEGGSMEPGDILYDEQEHGDKRMVANKIAWHNVAEVLRRGGWHDWWIVQKVEGLAAHARTQSTDVKALREEVAAVRATLAEIKAAVVPSDPS